MNFRNLFFSGITLALALSVISPVSAQRDRRQATSSVNICTRVSQVDTLLDQRLADRRAALEERRSERAENLDQRRQRRQERQQEHQEQRDERRQEHYDKLRERADTDVELAAIVDFQEAIEAAVTARREAIKAANDDFRAGLDLAIRDRKAKVDAARQTYADAVNAAFEKAKADCAAGIDPETVRSDLRQALEDARAEYRTDIQAIEKLRDQVHGLIDERQAAVLAAKTEFQEALEQAKENLEAALGEEEEDEDETATSTED